MKRGKLLLFLLTTFLLTSSILATTFECSDGSELLEDRKEIDLENTKSINNLRLGLTSSFETAASNTFSADLIVDAQKFTLTDTNPSQNLELKKGEYTIKITNLTDSIVEIDIDGDSEEIQEKDSSIIKSLFVYITNFEGSYPNNTATVNGIAGDKKITLDNEKTYEIVKVEETDYAIELFSASDTNAIVNIYKCANETTKILDIPDLIPPEPNITQTNNSTNSTNNNTTTNNTETNQSLNETTGEPPVETNTTTQPEPANQQPSTTEESNTKENSILFRVVVVTIIILILAIIGILFLRGMKRKFNNTDATLENTNI
jgi:hypothetical protein|tara:strand:- start:9236 stop:10189 length:954 start_codon:yes stop_codon:yes gene_type:complete